MRNLKRFIPWPQLMPAKLFRTELRFLVSPTYSLEFSRKQSAVGIVSCKEIPGDRVCFEVGEHFVLTS